MENKNKKIMWDYLTAHAAVEDSRGRLGLVSHGAIMNNLLRDTNAVREEQQAMEIEMH